MKEEALSISPKQALILGVILIIIATISFMMGKLSTEAENHAQIIIEKVNFDK